MATVTISLPDDLKEGMDARLQEAGYTSISDYLHDLIRRDCDDAERELTVPELRAKLVASRASGISDRTVEQIYAEARATHAQRN